MNVHRFDEEQRQHWVSLKRTGERTVKQILKEAGISRATLYNWLEEFPEAAAAPETEKPEGALPSLEEVRTVRSGGARHRMLAAALAEVDESGEVRSAVVRALVRRHTMSVPQACELAGLPMEQYGYRPRKPEADDREVYEELCRLLEEVGTRSFDDLITLLKGTQPAWPRKQIRRIYKEGRLYQRRTKPAKKVVEAPATPEAPQAPRRPYRPDTIWTLGVASVDGAALLYALDAEDGQPLAAITLPGDPVAAEAAFLAFLADTATAVGAPRKVRVPGIAPFNAREVLRWAMQTRVALQTLSLGKEENAAEWSALNATVATRLSALPGSIEDRIPQWTTVRDTQPALA